MQTWTLGPAGRLSSTVKPRLVSTLVGCRRVCVEVVEPNVFLFQRDFFTVCFSPLFVCEEGAAFWGREELLGASECHRSLESPDSVHG